MRSAICLALALLPGCADDATTDGAGGGGATGATSSGPSTTTGPASGSGTAATGGASASGSGGATATGNGGGGAAASSGCEGGGPPNGGGAGGTAGSGGLGGAAANCDDYPNAVTLIDPPWCATTVQVGDPVVVQFSPGVPDQFTGMMITANGFFIQPRQDNQPDGTTHLLYPFEAGTTYEFTAGWFCNAGTPDAEQLVITAQAILTAVP